MLTRLDLTDFRNHARTQLAPARGLTALYGANGAGKTALLEAVTCLTPGRSLRGAGLGEMARRDGAGGWAVSARVKLEAGEHRLGAALSHDAAGRPRRLTRLDGDTVSPAELGALLPMLWLTPAQDRLFMEGASERRRFLDRFVYTLHPEHAAAARGYDKAMAERNRLLEGPSPSRAWLAAIEARMAENGIALALARGDVLARLSPLLAADTVTGLPAPDIGFSHGWKSPAMLGQSQALTAQPAADLEDAFAQMLADNRARDARAGRTLQGPHRADLDVRFAGSQIPAAQGSTGEQRALVLALILAQARLIRAETGRSPLLLLDEVVAHYDHTRIAAVLSSLAELGAQILMTAQNRDVFEALLDDGDSAHALIKVDGGTLAAERA